MIRIAFLAALLCILNICNAAESRIDGRYSFSLTTFDPNGKLNQVERASRAAFLGTPVVALCRPNAILLAAPQALPNSLVEDDGTARFVKVSPDIVVAHSGVAADGRIAIAAGQRLAVEHEFTFDETIPVQVFLEAMALLFQEYTMKAGARPFGCALLVGSLDTGELYRLDPSGSVETLGLCGVVGSLTEKLHSKVDDLSIKENDHDQVMASLTTLLREALRDESQGDKQSINNEPPIITAMFTNDRLVVDCVDQQSL
jgi:20S proteasome alpha/beta subunit